MIDKIGRIEVPADKIRKVEPIPDDTKINPDYISKRDVQGTEEFRNKLDEEIKKRLKHQKTKANP